MTKKIYLAGPIQHVNDYGKGWRSWIKETYAEDSRFDFVDPMERYNTMQEAEAEWTSEDVVEDDLELIRECNAVLAHWEAVPTAGTPMEIFYAHRAVDIPTVVQTTLHEKDVSPWIEYHAHSVHETFEDALEAIAHA